MAKLVRSPAKYLPSEWHNSNRLNHSAAEQERAAAERLRAECHRLRKETDASTARTQQDVQHKFSQRLRDIQFWKSELEQKLTDNASETEDLLQRKELLEQALVGTQFPLEVAKTCLGLREQRTSTDLVHDDVEIHLLKEVEVVQGVQDLLQKTLDHTVEQIRLMRSCKYKLEKDLKEKHGALEIDNTCATLTDDAPGLMYSQDAVKVQTNSVTPEEWALMTDENVRKTEQERNASATLRGMIDGILVQTTQDIESERVNINSAFEKRRKEIAEAKLALEQQLQKVLHEINATEANIAELHNAIEAKQGPMMLAQTRLEFRSKRPSKELVRDPVQYGLVEEVGEISGSVEQLRTRLAESESALKALIRSQLSLEEDIGVKTNTLHIEDQCMALRKQLSIASN